MDPLTRHVAILGGASCVHEDFAALEALVGRPWPGLVIAVNDIGCHWPRPIDGWVSLHPEKFYNDPDHPKGWGWIRQRRENGYPDGFLTIGKRNPELVDRIVTQWASGSSGFLALPAAVEVFGCGPDPQQGSVALCGIPMDHRPHFDASLVHRPGKEWSSADSHWKGWKRNLDRLHGWVRSMSGRTKDHLGAPDAVWLGLEERRDVA